MAWVQLFPTGATLISDSVNQIQDNWLFLQNNINTDHFFNTGAPTEGHHRYFVTQNQADPGVLLLDAMLYSKTVGTVPTTQLACKTAEGIRTVSMITSGKITTPTSGAYTLIDFAGQAPCMGMVFFADESFNGEASAFYGWSGTALFQAPVTGSGSTPSFNVVGSILRINVSNALTGQWYLLRNNWV